MTTENSAPQLPPATNGKSKAIERTSEHITEGAAISAFASVANFESAQRMAQALASSSIVPVQYQKNVANCLIAIEMASRIRASVLAVMQSLNLIHNKPSWASAFLIATVNTSGRFTPIRFRWQGTEGTESWGCRAVAKERESGEECLGSLITMKLARAEGWLTKKDSKWQTMPEQMLMYRAAAFWTRVYAPELSLGMQTAEEVIDVQGETVTESTYPNVTVTSSSLEDALMSEQPSAVQDAVVEPADETPAENGGES